MLKIELSPFSGSWHGEKPRVLSENKSEKIRVNNAKIPGSVKTVVVGKVAERMLQVPSIHAILSRWTS